MPETKIKIDTESTDRELCPCGSQHPFDQCCEPIIQGVQKALSAEQLMRARYTAYAKTEIEFIIKTLAPKEKGNHDEKGIRKWSEKSEWLGLEIKDCKNGGESDETGSVEFIAHYRSKGIKRKHHEMAEFKKYNGSWRFETGSPITPEQFIRESPKIGRNDFCPCDSGKKFKKCCGKAG
jgi:SEC-C motif-containing protein